ncbi:hypothetical protein D3879_01550 [Pseudomonas cavernicola]|uniref:Uncharacterized protein n=1 Tax=Pseudomonas cavernicola TaxID=2320866 RepID=A0A418XHT0_9PSED|nr:hypothetical protein [Pseudomonas cavernicola]RJG12039.1 hypothetical protein D3879_01550 [Pseudomonas cavernicola]
MLAMNKKMDQVIQGSSWDGRMLPPELSELLAPGFFKRDGCTFLASLAKGDTNVSASDFPDKTGYECFVNSVHIDDYVECDYVVYACLFVEEFFNAWRSSNSSEIARAIISSDELGALVKFHVARGGESWVGEDLEKYEEAILVADSLSKQKLRVV